MFRQPLLEMASNRCVIGQGLDQASYGMEGRLREVVIPTGRKDSVCPIGHVYLDELG